YIGENPMVTAGLTWDGVVWAFSSFKGSNYHPLTWLSHMLDCQLFGASASGPHVESVVLHFLVSALLYVFLKRTTGATRKSALCALLFALHPAHVESVAWVAERKDLL